MTAQARYVYDHGGRRMIKRESAGGTERTTYYVSEGYEIREGRPVKYVFAGDRRVARIEGRLTGGGTSRTLDFAAGWNFFCLEVEPDDPAVEAVLAPIAGSYTGVWAYDAAAQRYVGHVPSQSVHDLSASPLPEGIPHPHHDPGLPDRLRHPGVGGHHARGGVEPGAFTASQALPVAEAFVPIAGQLEAVWGYAPGHGGWQVYAPSSPTGVIP